MKKAKNSKGYDLIIIGCGPAGMASALYAARQKLNFLLIGKDIGGLANYIPHVETYLGYHYLSGFELVEKFREHLESFKMNHVYAQVNKISKAKMFTAHTDKGDYRAKALLIATGRKSKKLGIPGEEQFASKGVSYCTVCEGPLFRNKDIAIIGGGRSGLLSTLFVKDFAKKIYLIEAQKHLGGTSSWRNSVKKIRNVKVLTSTKPVKIIGDRMVSGLEIKGKKHETLKVGGVFIEVGYSANTGFAKGVIRLNSRQEIVVDKENATSVPGIFAAGDCTDIQEKQVVVSVGEGAKALLSVLKYLGFHEKASTHLQSIMAD